MKSNININVLIEILICFTNNNNVLGLKRNLNEYPPPQPLLVFTAYTVLSLVLPSWSLTL